MDLNLPTDLLPVASWHPNPLDARDRRELIFIPPLPEETVGEYIFRVGWDAPLDTYSTAYLDGRFVPKAEWLDVVFEPGQRLSVHAAHAGGEGSDVGRIVGLILVAVAAFYLGPLAAAAWGPLGGAAASAAIMVGGQMIVNALFPINTKEKIEGAAQDPTYSLTGGANSSRPYEPLPLIVGKHRVFPDLDEKPWTYFEGTDQYLVQAFNFGLGEIEIIDQRIGESTLDALGVSNFEIGKTTMTNVDTEPGSELKFSTGWVTRSSPIDTVEIALDLSAILVMYGSDGAESNLTATFSIETAPYGSGTWTPVASLPSVQTGVTADVIETSPVANQADPDASPPAGTGWELVWMPDDVPASGP